MTEEAEPWGGAAWAAADLITPMAIRVVATLRLADHIAAGIDTAEALAQVVEADPETLPRLMARLVVAGVLTDEGEGRFGLTSTGEQLREGAPDSVRAWLDLEGAIGRGDLSLVQLLHSVRTGRPAFPRQFGADYWDDLASDPQRQASFDALMGQQVDLDQVVRAYPWASLGRVVDVGGGNGTLLIAILRGHAGLRGTVADLAGPVSRAKEALAEAGLTDRADTRVVSFFDALPRGAGGYVLSRILHDWPDTDAVRILRRCREAAGESGKVLVVEQGAASGAQLDTEGDLRMLCLLGGRERTVDQLVDLARSAGLRLGSVSLAGSRSVVELLPESETANAK